MDIVDIVLAKALAGGGGGGGGGSAFPPITTTEAIILAEQSVTVSSGRYTIAGAYDVSVGETIVTTWNGTEYTNETTLSQGATVWGNQALKGGTDTGEPFFLVYAEGNGIIVFAADGTYTLKIATDLQTPVDGTALSVHNGAWAASGAVLPPFTTTGTDILAEQSVTIESGQGTIAGAYDVSAGGTIVTTWDGTEYTNKTMFMDGGIVWGNLAVVGGVDTGEPFLIAYMEGSGLTVMSPTDGTYTIKIVAVQYSPADGSVMMAKNGAWTPTMGKAFYVGMIPSSSKTISSASALNVGFTHPDGITGEYQIVAASHYSGATLIFIAGQVTDNSTYMTLYNPTGSSISLTTNSEFHAVLIPCSTTIE